MYYVTLSPSQPPKFWQLRDREEYPTLREELNGGWLEHITLTTGLSMYVDEEGKLKELPQNSDATAIFSKYRGPYDIIVGPAILCSHDSEGTSQPLLPEYLDHLSTYLGWDVPQERI